jgi:hypothetical protein
MRTLRGEPLANTGNNISYLFPKLSGFFFWIYCQCMDIQNSTRFIDYMTCKRKKEKN